MTVYVLNGAKAKEFKKLCNTLSLADGATEQMLLDNGFTNFNEPYFYFAKPIIYDDKYPVSFTITISKKTMKIKEISIMDNQFGQPHFCDETALNQINQYVNELIEKKDIEKGRLIADLIFSLVHAIL